MCCQGKHGYKRLLEERKHLAAYMNQQLETLAADERERVLLVSNNEVALVDCCVGGWQLGGISISNALHAQISFAMTLGTFCSDVTDLQEKSRQLTLLGAMLFSRGVSGAR